jgi:hypothetical protein
VSVLKFTGKLLAALVAALVVLSVPAAETLSEQVRKLIDEKGVEVARQEAAMLVVSSGGEIQSDEKGMLALADDYLEKGNVDAAEMVLQLQMMTGPSAGVTARLGDVYMAKGVPIAAVAFYQQALEADPANEHAKSQLAVIAEKHPEMQALLDARKPHQSASKPAQPSAEQKPAPSEERPQPQGGGDSLLPYVVVRDPAAVDSLDWDALRKEAGTDYPSRWDDLTLVDSCVWISPKELEEHLGLSARLTSKRIDYQCKYWVHFPNGDSTVLLQVYVEYHPKAETVLENKRGFSEGVSGRQFTPFDPGAADLEVYVHRKGKYLYAFPRDGVTMWRIGYKGAGPERDRFYQPKGDAGIDQDLGPRFLRLLVDKYEGRL